MASNMISEIRQELSKIKGLRKQTAQKLTAETLKLYKGFENLSTEKRQQLLDAMREFATIAVLQLNRLITLKTTENEHNNKNRI
ncbi:hypothetical protein [Fluviicola sp.]|uniref:hypothetical protein n=1 Tax=Fluviicola sp. TaxID=1917219 RepID=UPI0031D3BD1E